MSTTSSAIADLQSQWHTLPDLDRAKAVLAIKQSGISTRSIAQHLNCSEPLLRHLLTALQAPPADRFLARQGKISTNELARRSKTAGIRRSSMHREAREFERTRAALQGCRAICEWLAAEQVSGPYSEQIINEARHLFAQAEQDGKFPPGTAPADMPAAEIIQHCRPAELKNNSATFIAQLAWRLALWTFYAMTDSWVRDSALDLALDEQSRR